MHIELNVSWLDGQYTQGEINTSLTFLSLGDLYLQGHEAIAAMEEIQNIWEAGDLNQQQAVNVWMSNR